MSANHASRLLAIIIINIDDFLIGGSFCLSTGGKGKRRSSERHGLGQSCLIHFSLNSHQVLFQLSYFGHQICMGFPALLDVE